MITSIILLLRKQSCIVPPIVVTVWMYYICLYTIESELIWTRMHRLNHRGKCLNKGNKLVWGFAIMSGTSKEWFLRCDSLISRYNLQFWLLRVQVPVIVFLYCNFSFAKKNLGPKHSKNVLQSTNFNTLIHSLLFMLKFLERLVLFGNKSLQGLFKKIVVLQISLPCPFFFSFQTKLMPKNSLGAVSPG